MSKVEEYEVTSEAVVDSLRTLADQVEQSADVDASVVCLIRVDSSMRMYAIGDDLNAMIAQASAYLDGAIQTLMIQNRSTH